MLLLRPDQPAPLTWNQVTADDDDSTPAGDDGDDFEGFGDDPIETPANDGTEETSLSEHDAPTATESKPNTNAARETQETQKKDKKQQQKKKNKSITQTEDDRQLESNVFASAKDAAVDDASEDVDMSKWSNLDLSPQMISCLARLKFTKPTDIQSAAIRKITAGHDVIGKASTGSGKTLAFAIPIVEAWLSRQGNGKSEVKKSPIGLVMSPTRELAHQITNHIKALCEGLTTPPYICSVTGGLSVHKQQRQLEKADIVIGTPGRLWEVLSSSSALLGSFKTVSFLVVDEADRLLTDGHFKEAEEILKAIDRVEVDEDDDGPELFPRQTLVFSATFNKNLQQKLAGKGKSNLMDTQESMEYLLKKLNFREEKPKFVDVNPVAQMAQGLKEGLVECGAMEKVRQERSHCCFKTHPLIFQ
jgi:ATP-dependent RNA helicase DDX24/MAK5